MNSTVYDKNVVRFDWQAFTALEFC